MKILFFILLIDSLVANLLAWTSSDWYVKHFRTLSRFFPLTKGWAGYYLVLVLIIGYILYK